MGFNSGFKGLNMAHDLLQHERHTKYFTPELA